MPHDFDSQRAETLAAYNDLQGKHGLPEVADVDYFFIPTQEGADWRPLAEALHQDGFECEFYEAEGDDPSYLRATLPDQTVSATGIWIGEEIATKLALEHGFTPDGWGMES